VLVLPHADGSGVDLHQLRQGVLEAAADGDGPPEGEVQVGELPPGRLGGGVDRGAALAHSDQDRTSREVEPPEEGLRLPPPRAVAHGDRLRRVGLQQAAHRPGRLLPIPLARGDPDHPGGRQVPLGIQQGKLAARPDPRVHRQHGPPPQGRLHQQVPGVPGEDPDGLPVRPFLQPGPDLRLQGGGGQAPVALLQGGPDLLRRGPPGPEEVPPQDPEGLLLGGQDRQGEQPLPLAPEEGQDPVGGGLGGPLLPVEVVPVLGPLLLLAPDGPRAEDPPTAEEVPQVRPGPGLLGDPLGQDVPGPPEGLRGVGHPPLGIHEGGRLGLRVQGGGPPRPLGPREGPDPEGRLEEPVRQGLQPPLPGDGGPGAPLGPEGQVEVLQPGSRGGLLQGDPKGLRQQASRLQGAEDRLPALLQLLQPIQPIPDRRQGHLVQAVRGLLAVPGDEGEGAALLQQLRRGPNLLGAEPRLGGHPVGPGEDRRAPGRRPRGGDRIGRVRTTHGIPPPRPPARVPSPKGGRRRGSGLP